MEYEIDLEACERFLNEKYLTRKWSHSAVSSFDTCPFSFYESYVLGIRRGNYHQYVGSSYHSCMEDFYNFLIGGGVLPLEDVRKTLTKKLQSKFDKNPYYCHPRIKNSIEANMLNSINSFYPNNRVKFVERKIEFKIDNFNFVGYLDLDEGAGETHYDFKSKIDKDHYPQQYLYMYGKKQVDNITPRGFAILAYKQNLEKDYVKYDREEVGFRVNEIQNTLKDIKEALLNGDFPKTNPSDFFCTQLCGSTNCKYSKV